MEMAILFSILGGLYGGSKLLWVPRYFPFCKGTGPPSEQSEWIKEDYTSELKQVPP